MTQPAQIFGGAKYFDIKRGTVFGLMQNRSKHKMKRYVRSLQGDHVSPGCAYEQNPVVWFFESLEQFNKPEAFNSYVISFIKHSWFWPENQTSDKPFLKRPLVGSNPRSGLWVNTNTLGTIGQTGKNLSNHYRGLLKHFKKPRRVFQQLCNYWAIHQLTSLKKQTCWILKNFIL